ncbi:MAG: hypothetical protein HYV97_18665 [Bdellovibrio sp.]|nr:hypothetical protein [Bdellovibrio sp.]
MKKTNVSGVVLLMVSIWLASCGGPKGNQVKLSLSLGAIVTSAETAGGGMLYGRKTDGSEKWTLPIAQGAEGVDKTLNNGNWEFYAIIWRGPRVFEGTVRCGTGSANLDGSATNVSINVNVVNCNNAQFAEASYHDSTYGFLPLRIVSCNNFVKVTSANSVCEHPTADMGNSKSFKIQMRGSQSSDPSEGHWSTCISQAGLVNHRKNDSVYFSNIRLPIGATVAFPVSIHAFTDENCTENWREYPFPNGIGGPGDFVSGRNYTATFGPNPLEKEDYQLWPTTNPFAGSGSGAYSTTQSTDLTFTRVIYKYTNEDGYSDSTSSAPNCNTQNVSVPGLPGGYKGNPACPRIQDWTCLGTQCTGGYEPPHCLSDYSNSQGPNCDAGSITLITVTCNKDNYPDIVCDQTSITKTCGGTGAATCGWNGGPNPAPSYSSLYLIDNEYGVANSALAAQTVDIQCQSGSGSGAASAGCFITQKDHEKSTMHEHDDNMGMQNNYSEFYQVQGDLFGFDDPDTSHSDGHRELGAIGSLRAELVGAGIGGILYRRGYTDCNSIPITGSISTPMNYMENIILQFAPGQKVMPSWAGSGSGSGTMFEKRITLLVDDTLNQTSTLDQIIEFNCSTNIKSGYKYDIHNDTSGFNEKELYYKVNSITDTQFEAAGYSSGSWGGQVSIRHSLQGFKKKNGTDYQLWSSEVSRWDDDSDGSGSSVESWHAQNIMATGNRTKVRLSSFDGDKKGNIALPTAASAYISGVPLRIDASGSGPAFNGMRISIYGSGVGSGIMNDYGSGTNPETRWITGNFLSGSGGSSYQDIIDAFNNYQTDFTMAWDISESSSYGANYGSGGASGTQYSNNNGSSGNHLYLSGGSNANEIMSTNGKFKINYFTQNPNMSYINNSDPHDEFYRGLAIFASGGSPGWITNRYGNHCNNGNYNSGSGGGTYQVVGVVGSGFGASTSYNLGMVENPFATLNTFVGTSVIELALSGSGTGGSGTGYGMGYIQNGMLLGPSSSGSGFGTVVESTGNNKFRVWVQSGSFSAGQTFTINFYATNGSGSSTGGSGSGDGTLMDVIDIAVGFNHACAVVGTGGGSGDVFCWGMNSYGQLGDGTNSTQSVPVQVQNLSSVVAIAAGEGHSCALQSGGSVQCWGNNSDYQLGDGSTANRNNPVIVQGVTGANAISAGGKTTCVKTLGGGAVCWGYNSYGQLGDGSTLSRGSGVGVTGLGSGVMAVAVGGGTSCALLDSGSMKCWGDGYEGQLGNDNTAGSLVPVTVGTGGGLSGIMNIGAGQSHVCATLNDGSINCWGDNSMYQLGIGSGSGGSLVPATVLGIGSGSDVFVGGFHTCALDNFAAKCWGKNTDGQLGDGTYADKDTPSAVNGLLGTVTKIAVGGNNTCAILDTTEVQCWGANYDAQLGIGSGGGSSNSPLLVVNSGNGGSGSGSGGGGNAITYSIVSVGSGTGSGYAIDCFDSSTRKWSDGCSGLTIDDANVYGQVHWPNGSGSGGGVQFSPDWVLQNVKATNITP